MHGRDGNPPDKQRMPWEMDADERDAVDRDAETAAVPAGPYDGRRGEAHDAETVAVPAGSAEPDRARTAVLPAGPPRAQQGEDQRRPARDPDRAHRSPYPDEVKAAWPQGSVALILVALAACAGAWLAGTSTHDFATHLDGQVHALTCSVVPGADTTLGASGCKEAMLSPYSSIWRDRIWGGVPVALGGLAVFAFIAALAFGQALSRSRSRHDTAFLLLATTVPVLTSAYFAWLSHEKVGSFCTVCIGIYGASGATWVLAWIAHLRSPGSLAPAPWGRWLLWTLEGFACVGLIGWLWFTQAPKDRASQQGCGTLVAEDKADILVPLPRLAGATPALMAIDPLCPACRAFDQRLRQSGLEPRLGIDLLLFPLDSKCNWMVKDSLHPGACAVSEAVLCAPGSAKQILQWAFDNQPRLLDLGRADDAGLRQEITRRFPVVKRCLGGAAVKAKVNKSLRFAVANAMPVLTPQLYVNNTRLCDEDTDLGLEYTLGHMLMPVEAPAGGRP